MCSPVLLVPLAEGGRIHAEPASGVGYGQALGGDRVHRQAAELVGVRGGRAASVDPRVDGSLPHPRHRQQILGRFTPTAGRPPRSPPSGERRPRRASRARTRGPGMTPCRGVRAGVDRPGRGSGERRADGIENVWNQAKRPLRKFNGVPKGRSRWPSRSACCGATRETCANSHNPRGKSSSAG